MIGDLYNANAVVVGQAACLFAPANTPLPALNSIGKTNPASDTSFTDVFALAPWSAATVNPGSSTSFTLTYGGQTTTSLTVAGLTAAQIAAALGALPNVGVGNVLVTGSAGAWSVTFLEPVAGQSTLTGTFTGGSGSSITSPLWTPCGATDQGWTFGANKSTTDVTVEEQSPPVGRYITSQAVTVDGALSEDITRTLALAYNGLVTTTAQATGVPGTDEINPTDDVISYAVALLMKQFNGGPRVLYAPTWTQLSNVSTALRRASAKRMYPVSFGTTCKTSQIRMINFNKPGL